MSKLTIHAPAKVNLHLRIKARRPDGFHDLESIFLALNFGDTLNFEYLDQENALEIDMKGVNAEDNIIFKAITRFRQQTGFSQGLRVTVEKNIPLGGGLGGGSSNAAAALLAMNAMAGAARLNSGLLTEIAASLGSDVPFFFCSTGAAWVSGRGEQVQPIAPPKYWFVLVNPGFSSDTAAAYRILDEIRANSSAGIAGKQANNTLEKTALIRFLEEDPARWPFENDFLPVFLAAGTADSGHAAAYREILTQLREAGAGFAGLSGSGATCFGVFSDKKQAETAVNFLATKWPFTNLTFPLRLKQNQSKIEITEIGAV